MRVPDHLFEQRRPFLPRGRPGAGGEAPAAGLDADLRVGGQVQVPRRMVVLPVVRADHDEVAGVVKLEVQQGR